MIFSNLVSFLFICSSLSLVNAETCNQYELVAADYKCPATRLDRAEDLTKEACYLLCADSVDCEYFTFGEEGGKRYSGLCITCAASGANPEYHPDEGFNHYIMEDLTCPEATGIASESSCSDPYIFQAEDTKCNADRLWRSNDHSQMTIDECYQECRTRAECVYFTYGANHPDGHAWEGLCILCGETADFVAHDGFLHYKMNDECEDNPNYNAGGSNISPTSGVYGDPHMLTWSGKNYDFHGICDLVLVSNPALDIQIRTHKINEWSYVEAASLRIGDDVLEVTGGKDSMNKVRFNGAIHEFEKRNKTVLDISGYPVVFTKTSDKSQKIEVHLGDNEKISFSTWNSFVSVKVQNPSEEVFGSSVGLMGSFPSGKMVARDNKTILNDVNEFGNEWQVKGDEATLFHKARVPQFPQECEIPSSLEMRRRLEASDISVQGAEIACASVEKYLKDLCMFDVMASSDVSIAGAY
jgi:hypothetical protein